MAGKWWVPPLRLRLRDSDSSCVMLLQMLSPSLQDFKTFLDFVLAMENRTTTASMQYLFRLLDINRQGYLDAFTINYFFRAVCKRIRDAGHEAVDPADVKDEIFDMVAPEHPLRITFADLKRCKVGHTALYILIDVNGFWQYDNRESLMQQKEDEGDTMA